MQVLCDRKRLQHQANYTNTTLCKMQMFVSDDIYSNIVDFEVLTM